MLNVSKYSAAEWLVSRPVNWSVWLPDLSPLPLLSLSQVIMASHRKDSCKVSSLAGLEPALSSFEPQALCSRIETPGLFVRVGLPLWLSPVPLLAKGFLPAGGLHLTTNV